MKGKEGLVSLRELREMFDMGLVVDDFITRPEPCSPQWAYWPSPTIPHYLMDPEKAEKAEDLLNECTKIVGAWGQTESKKDTEEFQNASSAFKEATGVDAWEIISEAKRRWMAHIANRMGH